MKARKTTWMAVAVAATLTALPLSANATPAQDPDAHQGSVAAAENIRAKVDRDTVIENQISDKLSTDKTLKDFDVHVSVANGVATLTGAVESDSQKARAERLAHVKGVTSVVNDLTLDPNSKSLKTMLKETGRAAGDTAVEASKVAAEKTKSGLSRAGEAIDNTSLVAKVHTRFMNDDLLKGSDIKVDAKDNVVTLKGTVGSDAARAHAVELAQTTSGVDKVIDELVIR